MKRVIPVNCTAKITNENYLNVDLSTIQNDLWTLFVDNDGAVCFSLDRDLTLSLNSNKNYKVLNVVKTPPNAIQFLNKTENNNEVIANWAHIGVVVDSSNSSIQKTKSTKTSTSTIISSKAINIIIYINGVKSIEGSLIPQPIEEVLLCNTILYVGPNLHSGWRFTELRMWADCRTETEIDNEKENYLVLAVKRKRVQLRIKAPKKLFSPFSTMTINEPSELLFFPFLKLNNEVTTVANMKNINTHSL
jgi:hypothetical protein